MGGHDRRQKSRRLHRGALEQDGALEGLELVGYSCHGIEAVGGVAEPALLVGGC